MGADGSPDQWHLSAVNDGLCAELGSLRCRLADGARQASQPHSSSYWVVGLWDFPRVQITFVAIGVAAAHVALHRFGDAAGSDPPGGDHALRRLAGLQHLSLHTAWGRPGGAQCEGSRRSEDLSAARKRDYAPGCQLRVAGYGLRVASCQLPVASCRCFEVRSSYMDLRGACGPYSALPGRRCSVLMVGAQYEPESLTIRQPGIWDASFSLNHLTVASFATP